MVQHVYTEREEKDYARFADHHTGAEAKNV